MAYTQSDFRIQSLDPNLAQQEKIQEIENAAKLLNLFMKQSSSILDHSKKSDNIIFVSLSVVFNNIKDTYRQKINNEIKIEKKYEIINNYIKRLKDAFSENKLLLDDIPNIDKYGNRQICIQIDSRSNKNQYFKIRPVINNLERIYIPLKIFFEMNFEDRKYKMIEAYNTALNLAKYIFSDQNTKDVYKPHCNKAVAIITRFWKKSFQPQDLSLENLIILLNGVYEMNELIKRNGLEKQMNSFLELQEKERVEEEGGEIKDVVSKVNEKRQTFGKQFFDFNSNIILNGMISQDNLKIELMTGRKNYL